MREDNTFWPLLLDLASCLGREITDSALPEPCFVGILPGANVALDYCQECGDKCGMAWVRLTSIRPSGASAELSNPCGGPLEASIEVGISRCAPMGSEGEPPTMAEQLESAQLMMADQSAALRAIRCCMGRERDFDLGAWTPMGPMGGCVGGTWTVIYQQV